MRIDSETIEDVKKRVEHGMILLKEYKWLLDMYVVDFFCDNHWDKLTVSVQ